MGATHELRCWPAALGQVWDGTKTWELRFDDRDYAVADILRLEEYDPRTGMYGPRVIVADVVEILHGGDTSHPAGPGVSVGWVLMSLNVLSRTNRDRVHPITETDV